MVFTSLPLYLDPPNWNNQQSHQQTGSAHAGNELQTAIQPTPILNGGATGAATGGGSIRPNSMADRARMAKIPQPEQALKCPRCDSTNTKFCYFNNYSLSQPRHFCKTCRRYWTRGGALRSVPVGGGCRRNKRSKSSKSSSSTANADRQAGGASSSSSSTTTSGSSMMHSNFQHHPQLPFLSSLHTLSEYGGAPNLGLNFAGMQPIDHSSNYQVGGGAGSGIGLDQWRIQQLQHFPFLGGLGLDNSYAAVMTTTSAAGGIYNPFDSEQSGAPDGFNEEVVLPKATSLALISQLASVKMEDSNPQGLNLARQYLGISGNDQYWGGSAGGGGGGITGSNWAPGDLSGFNCSSSGNVL